MLPLILYSLPLAVLSQPGNTTSGAYYVMNVTFDPDSGYIYSKTEISNPADSCFLIAKGMKIQSLKAGGRAVRYKVRPSASSPNSMVLSLPLIPEKISIVYSGHIRASDYSMNISSKNLISGNLIELSDYIDWYPRILVSRPFGYTMNVSLPSEFVTVTNGMLPRRVNRGDRTISVCKSSGKTGGITLVAVPGLKSRVREADGTTVEVYYSRLPESYIDSLTSDLSRAVRMLTGLFGNYKKVSLVRIVYSPRPAGGYARAPLLLVSENYALGQRGSEYGYARDLRLDVHEIAHNWSRADVNTTDDWINEGLAEFSALLVSENLAGKKFADMLLKEYRDIVRNTACETSILETDGNSWEKDVNRYYKPVLLLNDLREKYGEEKLRLFLSELSRRFEESNTANTVMFLDVLEKTLGTGAREAFNEGLHRKNWSTKDASEKKVIPADSSLTGIWSGPLAQFGSAMRFVLNINIRDGRLVSTLDSPDQNVSGIPVSDFSVRNDTVSFGVGVAAAVYKGYLDLKRNTISGTWTQRGIDFPLTLTKEEGK